MRSAKTEAFWQDFCHHEGLEGARHEVVRFRTPPDEADQLLDQMLVGVKRVVSGASAYFGDDREEPLPQSGDYAVIVDSHNHPRLVWRTTNVAVAPLSAVTDHFVRRDSTGGGDRAEWLRSVSASMEAQAREYGFEMHADIEIVFESLEVVWPAEVAHRIRLLTPHLDRGIALLQRLNEQRSIALGLESILARIQTAVLTVTPALRIGFVNPAAETLLRQEDGLWVKDGYLAARSPRDQQRLETAVMCAHRRRGGAVVVPIQRKDALPAYRASVFVLRRRDALIELDHNAEVVLFVDDQSEDITLARTDVVARTFQLTPAEARLAVHLASGVSLTEAADRFGVTHNTVRAQLRAIFDKTDTHRQADLVRLLQTSGRLRISLS